ncbi:hypothetical protein FJZ31_27360 [Candidatus Poribacteria bacterium]|nr:hypothetical protein [Candidatus Poribacteria bacterium]
MEREVSNLKEYLLSESSEDAKRPLVYPFFKKLFGQDFKVESDAEGADGYVEGKLLVELKTKNEDWLKGLYQGLHYQKLGLSFPNVCVISHQFIGLWKLSNLPQKALDLAYDADSQIRPSEMSRINANKTSKVEAVEILRANTYLLEKCDFNGLFAKDIDAEIKGFTYALKHLEEARVQINLNNFIDHIDLLQKFFDKPLNAIHCFYAIVGYWSVASKVMKREETNELIVVDLSRNVLSEPMKVELRRQDDFERFVETHYIFTNEGSGITYDNYFSRFDEVISRLDPEYARQHGIFFTDHNLSKFAMWFVHERFEKNLSDRFIVFDPAGGSGNLITSLDWRGHLKHKIVSELQPDLLKVIERRMRVHEEDIGRYTIVPKRLENKGLNFLDKSAEEYIGELERVLTEKNLKIDKPLAFLLNPPYKNTDENVAAREQVEAEYVIDPSILELTGSDAGRERYLAFLGQIMKMAKYQHEQHPDFNPILMVFTPTSWLIPRPTYVPFRKEFDKHFKYVNGFIITSNEFFKLQGKWPLAFTIWQYNHSEGGNRNQVKLWDYTYLKRDDLAGINWSARIGEIDTTITKIIKGAKAVRFDISKKDIRTTLPKVTHLKTKKLKQQPRYDYSYAKRKEDYGKIVSGFPLADNTRHLELKRKCGDVDGEYVGFYDDNTPVRIKQDSFGRLTNEPDRIWFRLDIDFKGVNKSKIFNGPADNRSYCAYDLESAKATLTWFAITKSANGRYPIWANQFDIWKPNISKGQENYFFSLCFAFGLAENRCVVTKFEADNPVQGAPEVFVDNPMSTNNPDSFWSTTLDAYIVEQPATAHNLVEAIKELYTYWVKTYCPHGIIKNVGLKDEPYFKYFDYEDFLTPNSGLIQIRKFADLNGKSDLLKRFEDIAEKTKKVREELYQLLVEEFKYFD